MTLQQLHYFCELAKSQHYTKTAQKLGISQPSLSYAISELEKELDLKLFDRVSRKVVLNDKGKLFYHHVQQSLASLQAGIDSLHQENKAYTSTITIGFLHSISTSLLPDFIKRFRQANTNPNVHINFIQGVSGELEKGLLDGSIDLIFSVQQPLSAISHPIGEQPLCLYVSKPHPLSLKSEVNLSEVADEPLILVNTQSGLRTQIDQALQNLEKTPQIAFEANSCDIVMKYVSQGHGIAILPKSDPLPGYPTKELTITSPTLSRQVYLSYLPTLHISPDMQEALEKVIADMTPSSATKN